MQRVIIMSMLFIAASYAVPYPRLSFDPDFETNRETILLLRELRALWQDCMSKTQAANLAENKTASFINTVLTAARCETLAKRMAPALHALRYRYRAYP